MLVYIIGTKQQSDCVFPLVLWEKATVYKQLAPRWKIAKQLSGFNPLPLSIDKNYRLRKYEKFFLCNKLKIAVKPTVHKNSAVSIALLGKILNHLS